MQEPFPSGAVILSIDTEHIWGYFDELTESAVDLMILETTA